MPIYDIRFKPSVEKDLRRLPSKVVQRIMERIEALGAAPLGRGATKLSGSKALYRVRVGRYRIVYEVDSADGQVIVHYVRHRRDAYRTL